MKSLIEKLNAGFDLTPDEIAYSVAVLLSSTAPDEMKAQFLKALHQKGESATEIAAFVRQLIDRAINPELELEKLPGPVIDVCGTGGDGLDLFNVSTTIMFVLAAGGAVVLKHGNRAVTSKSGSADVLEALGIAIDLSSDDLKECVERHRLGFIFARQYHPAFRALAEMRVRLARENQRTIFNLLGPLLNPARPKRQLIGVFASRLTNLFAEVLHELGHEQAWIVHGLTEQGKGIDDISISGATTVAELEANKLTTAVLDVSWLGISRAPIAELRGGTALENAAILEGILAGNITGAKRDMVLANAGGGFVIAGLASDLKVGIELAREQIDSGAALKKLRDLQAYHPRNAA
jgi:anthranilate phosphoribosyltransferase